MRRVVFRTLWLLIGLVVAVSLFKLAFTGSKVDAEENPLTPTGKAPVEEVVAEKGTISNTLTVEGTIVIDKPVAATAPVSGVLAHKYAETGAKVEKGDPLFQIRVEEEAATEPENEAEPEPATGEREGRGEPEGTAEAEAPEERAPAEPTYRWFTIVAPASGTVGTYATGLMEEVAEDAAVVSVKRETFHAVGAITPLDRYRLASDPRKATVEIKGGPKPFTCARLTIGEAATETVESEPEGGEMGMPEGETESEAGSKITCVVPRKVTVYDGLTMTMTIDAGKTDGKVVVIPVTSVKGLFGDGTVWVLGEDGTPTEHPVTLGETDGKQVEVTGGLKAGDRVLRYVPGSTPEPEGREEMVYG